MQFETQLLRQCWFLAGPTACGKSAAALCLAERLSAEIVSLDSMAIYRGMDIGTAKPSLPDRQRVPHHLIDIVDPDQDFSLAEFVVAAETACRQIVSRNRIPLFVGGTGMYLRSLLRGVFDGPSADMTFRSALQHAARDQPADYLHSRLKAVDPAAAEALHPNDARRLIRALEVVHVTGRPLSAQQQQAPLPVESRPANVFWLSPPRDWIYGRINRRVTRMIDDGLVDEVRRLMPQADDRQPFSRTARQALGYKEIIAHLTGDCSLTDAIDTIQTRTRQFAKRQHTWFRNLEETVEVPTTGTESPEALAELVIHRSRQLAAG